ncbi:cobalamin biosynthesis protein CbiX [Knoellia sinensis KCTC 19936]|uniref:Cobalamin biosynthesis protein CbiX n=2 Tax=Knoellia TaxID=136099 RepID=A0A0A0JBB6_9MICO|nr:CbiX/SirB N-terminal domain-containing protein [Knoellia sinensis]KGN34074.1 cobalamin biosynthesis protein CbiX [Knoellia sinensis KCTC 19936]
MEHTAVVLVAHGTRDVRGAETVRRLARRVDEALPTQEVALAYVDVQEPLVGAVLDDVMTRHASVVVVPLLLSRGFHVDVDIANAVAAHPGSRAVAPLGPDPLLAQLLVDRLVAAGVERSADVVLAAAGSSRPVAADDVEFAALQLGQLWDGPVTVAYAAGTEPSVASAVVAARDSGADRVAVASYLLAEGFFHDRLGDAGADVVTPALAAGGDSDSSGLDALLAVVLSRLV